MIGASDDPYYSRVGQRWELAERQDPVVWPSSDASRPRAPLDATALAAFRDHGYLVLPALFSSAEVATLMREIERLTRAADPTRDDVITEPDSDVIRSLFRVHELSALCLELIADERMAGVARQLLGSDVYLHQSRLNLKPAFSGQAFPWHSDFETWHIEDGMPRIRALSASLLLTPNTEHNGPLLVVPGSHKSYVRCVGETPPDHFRQSLRHQAYGVPDPEALTELVRRGGIASVTGPPGTVVFFDANLMHGSAGNITPLPRHNLFSVFNSVDNRLRPPYGGTPPRPGFLAERDPDAILPRRAP